MKMSNEPVGLDQFLNDAGNSHPISVAPTTSQHIANNLASTVSKTPSGLDEFIKPEMEEKQYGSIQQQSLAALEGAARGASLGGSDWLETKFGLATPEAIRKRQEIHPVTSALFNMAGGAALIGATGGLAAPIEGALTAAKVAPLAARIAGFGAEGAVFGAGNVVSDAALGDTNLNAQKIASDIGFGAVLGGGLGALSKGIEAMPIFRKSASEAEKVASKGIEAGESPIAEGAIYDAPGGVKEGKTGISPTSIDEIAERVRDASYRGEAVEMPSKKILADSSSRVPLDNPIHPLQVESLNDQATRDLYKTALEMPSKEGDALRSYEALQKSELGKRTDMTFRDLAPESELISDAKKGGEKAIDAFTENYQKEKAVLGPAFEALKETELGNIDHLPGVVEKMTDAVPGVARMFNTEGKAIELLPYKPSWGIDKSTYNAVKTVIEDLKDGTKKNFQELSNLRKSLDQNVNILEKGQGPREVMALKKAMMDYMQEVLEKADPFIKTVASEGNEGASVRELFKRYAINEQQREVIEKAFGASVGSPEFGAISKIKPEDISDKIFKNTATVKAAKEILGEAKFNELLANHLAEQKSLATDKGIFSSNKFGSYLKKNQDALNEAFSGNPKALEKIKDINNIMRILPDSQSINPSGTAKTLWGILHAHSIPDLLANAKEFGAHKLEERMMSERLNAHLAGKADQSTKLGIIKNIIDKTNNKINVETKGIFNKNTIRGGAISGAVGVTDTEYNKRVNRIKDLAGNPTTMMDHLDNGTGGMYSSAPNITQSLNNTVVAGVQFLNSKIPGPQTHMPLSREFVPSFSQMLKFNNYYQAVNDPISALTQVKHGILTNETMEALTAVHPQLLDDMKKSVIDNFNPEKAQMLDYGVKISLSRFLGEPLDENMLGPSIISYQQSLSGPQLSNQQGMNKQKPTLGGMKEMDIAGRSTTDTQALESSDNI